jgi:hypothetical protein
MSRMLLDTNVYTASMTGPLRTSPSPTVTPRLWNTYPPEPA